MAGIKLPPGMFSADFVSIVHSRPRSVYKFSFEVDEEVGDVALETLGGLPKEGESRPVLIWRPNLRNKASVLDGLARLERLKDEIEAAPEENDNEIPETES